LWEFVTHLLVTAQANILRNIDYIPISNWGFDETVTDLIKEQKHAAVNKTLSKTQQKKLDNEQKQKVAKSIGSIPQSISEVLNILSHSKLANKAPTKAVTKTVKKATSDDTKENHDGPELSSEVAEILKKKGVGKRPHVRSVSESNKGAGDAQESKDGGSPFKKQKKQHKPLTDADKTKRREMRKQNRQKKSSQAKEARNAVMKEEQNSVKSEGIAKQPDDVEKSEMSFSKLEFVIKDDKPLTKREKSEKLSGRDYASLHKKVQKRTDYVEKIREKNPEKAQGLEERIKWDSAMKRAEGKKVKDDLGLLSKAIKKKGKMKEKRKQKWDDRSKKVEEDQEKRQTKRQDNIEKRRDEKVKKKLERARKKGRLV